MLPWSELATDTREPVRRELLTVGAYYEQFAGWMSQNVMDPAGARRHYDHAMQAAQEARGHALDRSAALTYAAADHPAGVPAGLLQLPGPAGFSGGVAYVELGRHADAVPLLAGVLGRLVNGYDRDRGRYAGMLALALAGAGEVEEAVVCAKRAAELTVATGSALAAQELRRVRIVLRERGVERAVGELAEHSRALTVVD